MPYSNPVNNQVEKLVINTNKPTARTAKADSTGESPVDIDFEEKLPETPPQDARLVFVGFCLYAPYRAYISVFLYPS